MHSILHDLIAIQEEYNSNIATVEDDPNLTAYKWEFQRAQKEKYKLEKLLGACPEVYYGFFQFLAIILG